MDKIHHLFLGFGVGIFLITVGFIFSAEKEPEYKINLLNQTEVEIFSTSTQEKDTIRFEEINNWIEKNEE